MPTYIDTHLYGRQVCEVRLDDVDVLARGRRGESLEVGSPGRVPHEREDRAV